MLVETTAASTVSTSEVNSAKLVSNVPASSAKDSSASSTASPSSAASDIIDSEVAEYFSSLSAPARKLFQDVAQVQQQYQDTWHLLQPQDRDRLIDDILIPAEARRKYGTLPSKKRSAASSVPPGMSTATVRLSSFGVEQVFPRLKINSGQKEATLEDCNASQAEELSEFCSKYSYRDEHSAPFSWMTKSQQELRFESGKPESMTSDELNDNSLEVVGSSPSRILNRTYHVIRQSRGNPMFAKKVDIPVVPELSRSDLEQNLQNRRATSNPPVSPHRINNFVYETSGNRLVVDFGDSVLDTNSLPRTVLPPRAMSPAATSESSSSRSAASHQGLLAKMKETRATLRRSLSAGRRKHKSGHSVPTSTASVQSFHQQLSPAQSRLSDSASSCSSMTSLTISSRLSQTVSSSNGTLRINKPCVPPPPPPTTRPSRAPPPPPRSTVASSASRPVSSEANSGHGHSKQQEQDVGVDLEGFKVDLNTDSQIPKTGFDFLDNW